ncbi:MAG: TolC family protein [Bacteroidetes bacterium]|nr:TolC family protein [Bacteroidota bacterium]MBS1641222.1 TolC family protein [Bacteroidota bacterium]MBS1670896.1 TolC family protein [Bacteroidota bacterium]
MKQLVFLILTSTFTFKLLAQEIIPITKANLKTKALDNNLQVKMANNEVALAEAELLKTRAAYLPNITATYTFINTNNPLMAFGSKLNQERITMTDFNPDNLNNPKSISNFETKIEVQQPIINMDAVYLKKAGQVKTDVLKIKTERTKEYILYELNKAYMMLQLAYKMLETLENAKQTTLANKKVMDDYFKNGMIQKADVLYMNVRVSEINNQIQLAKSNIKNASDYLYFLLNEDATDKILKPTESLEYKNEIIESTVKLNESRKDIQAYHKSLEAYNWLIKSSQSKLLPTLNAFGNFAINNNKIYQYNTGGYFVGLQLSWNIFDGLKSKSEQTKYKTELTKTQTEIEQYTKQSQLEFTKIFRQLQDANNKVSFTNEAWQQSKEAYRIRKNRYDQGLEKSADLLSSETLMSQKELEYYQAVFEYNSAFEYYKFLKS